MTYQPAYMPRFKKHLQTFHSLHSRIEKVVAQIIANPYSRTEQLTYKRGFISKAAAARTLGRTSASSLSSAKSAAKNPNVSTATVKD